MAVQVLAHALPVEQTGRSSQDQQQQQRPESPEHAPQQGRRHHLHASRDTGRPDENVAQCCPSERSLNQPPTSGQVTVNAHEPSQAMGDVMAGSRDCEASSVDQQWLGACRPSAAAPEEAYVQASDVCLQEELGTDVAGNDGGLKECNGVVALEMSATDAEGLDKEATAEHQISPVANIPDICKVSQGRCRRGPLGDSERSLDRSDRTEAATETETETEEEASDGCGAPSHVGHGRFEREDSLDMDFRGWLDEAGDGEVMEEYDYSKSTEENYRADHRLFTER